MLTTIPPTLHSPGRPQTPAQGSQQRLHAFSPPPRPPGAALPRRPARPQLGAATRASSGRPAPQPRRPGAAVRLRRPHRPPPTSGGRSGRPAAPGPSPPDTRCPSQTRWPGPFSTRWSASPHPAPTEDPTRPPPTRPPCGTLFPRFPATGQRRVPKERLEHSHSSGAVATTGGPGWAVAIPHARAPEGGGWRGRERGGGGRRRAGRTPVVALRLLSDAGGRRRRALGANVWRERRRRRPKRASCLPVGESNPGLPRDRRGYSPLY